MMEYRFKIISFSLKILHVFISSVDIYLLDMYYIHDTGLGSGVMSQIDCVLPSWSF